MNEHEPARAPREHHADERRLHVQLAGLGITAEEKTVYRYEDYTYERLEDALAFARGAPARDDRNISKDLEPCRNNTTPIEN